MTKKQANTESNTMLNKKVNTNLEGKVSGYIVWRQDWEESELGWGVRPDGYSLHLTQEQAKRFAKEYWSTMPRDVPSEYSRESGSPYKTLVNNKTYEEITTSRYGVRKWR